MLCKVRVHAADKQVGLLKNAPLAPGTVGGEMTPQGIAIPSRMGS